MSLLIIHTFDLFDNRVYNETTKSKEDSQMEKYKYDKMNGLWYELQGDYYLPCLTLPPGTNDRPIGVWAQAHKQYLLNYHKIRYTNLLTSCKLTAYLADIDEEANAMFDRLIKQFVKQEGVTEKLKSENQMLWVRKMNNIRNQATEIVNAELIYT